MGKQVLPGSRRNQKLDRQRGLQPDKFARGVTAIFHYAAAARQPTLSGHNDRTPLPVCADWYNNAD